MRKTEGIDDIILEHGYPSSFDCTWSKLLLKKIDQSKNFDLLIEITHYYIICLLAFINYIKGTHSYSLVHFSWNTSLTVLRICFRFSLCMYHSAFTKDLCNLPVQPQGWMPYAHIDLSTCLYIISLLCNDNNSDFWPNSHYNLLCLMISFLLYIWFPISISRPDNILINVVLISNGSYSKIFSYATK